MLPSVTLRGKIQGRVTFRIYHLVERNPHVPREERLSLCSAFQRTPACPHTLFLPVSPQGLFPARSRGPVAVPRDAAGRAARCPGTDTAMVAVDTSHHLKAEQQQFWQFVLDITMGRPCLLLVKTPAQCDPLSLPAGLEASHPVLFSVQTPASASITCTAILRKPQQHLRSSGSVPCAGQPAGELLPV